MPPRSTQNSRTAAAVAEDPQQSVCSHSRTPVPEDLPIINNLDPEADQEETADEDLTENLFGDHTTLNLAQAIIRECHGLPWGFPGKPAPVPVETCTHSHGYGF